MAVTNSEEWVTGIHVSYLWVSHLAVSSLSDNSIISFSTRKFFHISVFSCVYWTCFDVHFSEDWIETISVLSWKPQLRYDQTCSSPAVLFFTRAPCPLSTVVKPATNCIIHRTYLIEMYPIPHPIEFHVFMYTVEAVTFLTARISGLSHVTGKRFEPEVTPIIAQHYSLSH